jgi:hypothetical protein
MATPAVDYAALADQVRQQDNAPKSVDYAALADQVRGGGGVPAPKSFSDHASDFLDTLWDNVKTAPAVALHGVLNPIGEGSLYHPPAGTPGVTTDSHGGTMDWGAGNQQPGGQSKIASVPLVGPIAEAIKNGEYGKAFGHMANLIIAGGGLKAIEAATDLPDLLPNIESAGAKFQNVMAAAKDQPINLAAPGDVALRAQEFAGHGATMPKVFRDFLRTSTDPEAPPMDYETGRDFASNAGHLSAQDNLTMTGTMKAQVAKFAKAMSYANEEAADRAGVGDDYRAAMKEYRQAKQIQAVKDAVKGGAKYVVLGGAGAYTVKKVADLMK